MKGLIVLNNQSGKLIKSIESLCADLWETFFLGSLLFHKFFNQEHKLSKDENFDYLVFDG